MKNNTSAERAIWLADREIAHFEVMLSGMRQGIKALSRLTASYRQVRITNIKAEFLLMATQRRRAEPASHVRRSCAARMISTQAGSTAYPLSGVALHFGERGENHLLDISTAPGDLLNACARDPIRGYADEGKKGTRLAQRHHLSLFSVIC
jgi:hypothetical protein